MIFFLNFKIYETLLKCKTFNGFIGNKLFIKIIIKYYVHKYLIKVLIFLNYKNNLYCSISGKYTNQSCLKKIDLFEFSIKYRRCYLKKSNSCCASASMCRFNI